MFTINIAAGGGGEENVIPGYIGKLQSVLKGMLTELSEEELAELNEKREKWYIDGPSEEVRQKAAEMKGRKVVKDFQMKIPGLKQAMSTMMKLSLSYLARYNPTGKM
ncbi:hypothetical protein SERLA73DRAFT_149279 [Serpula lacrymans var. lacrymans S7.3]|uniref:Uncharacterized protein n=1 Tax=Serpula lacrymans var. lacrymans (strain S7.3) TaxID=936435 RepID=F8PHD7_SERL3|nr:hypothetical protein SERLA73DRAFT_149279 [Serpula lacrymans var. lacrymans S7.3]